jgi:type VI secretion system protein ImpG
LSFADAGFDPRLPATKVLSIETTCTNRDVPAQLRVGGGQSWSFQMEGQAPFRSITPLVGPSQPQRIPWEQTRWRLISHLSLNHLSLVGDRDAADALREVLKLYDYAGDRVNSQQIQGIQSVRSRRCVAPIRDGVGRGFCRGLEVTVEFDEEMYAGSGLFLFSAVLERFFGLYTTINTPTRMIARTRQQSEPIRRWPFRAGQRLLL